MPQTLRPKTFVDRDFEERLNYGGELWTRADIIRDMRQMHIPERCNDRRLQGANDVRAGPQLAAVVQALLDEEVAGLLALTAQACGVV